MKAFQFYKFGLENLKFMEIPEPKIKKPTEVKIKFKAQSINFRDYLMIMGKYNHNQKLPLIPLSDGVGEVIEVGEEVISFKKGDHLSPIFAQNWISGSLPSNALKNSLGGPLNGTLCEYAVFPENALVKVPDSMSFVEAATLPCAALTAYSALITHGQIKEGYRVLILGSGGVSIFAIQIAKIFKAYIIVITSQESKINTLYELGANDVIYSKKFPEWHEEVLRLTQNQGANIVIEVGGAGTLYKSMRAVSSAGHISLIGILAGKETSLNLLPILMRNICIQGILVGSKTQFELMNLLFSEKKVKPVIHRTFPFEESIEAFKHLQAANHIGKICISN